MTRLTKPVTRESATIERGRALIVTLHPRHLEMRPKGTRKSYSISYDARREARGRRAETRKVEEGARAMKPFGATSQPRRCLWCGAKLCSPDSPRTLAKRIG
jgi:hypothetical protein